MSMEKYTEDYFLILIKKVFEKHDGCEYILKTLQKVLLFRIFAAFVQAIQTFLILHEI